MTKNLTTTMALALALVTGAAHAEGPAPTGQSAVSQAGAVVQPVPAPTVAPTVPHPLAPVATAAPRAPEPSSGLLLILGGTGLLVGGAVNAASIGACLSSRVPEGQRPACVGLSAGFAVALLGAGLPLIVIGAERRAAWQEWTKSVRVGVSAGGASVGWVTSW